MLVQNWQGAFERGLCSCMKLFPTHSEQNSSLGLEITKVNEIFK